MKKTVHIKRTTAEDFLLKDIALASNMFSRMRGLLGRPALQAGEGLWITRCNSIHTIGMRYPIDVLFIDKNGYVLRAIEALRPLRLAFCFFAKHVLELAPGTVASLGIKKGEQLVWQEQSETATEQQIITG